MRLIVSCWLPVQAERLLSELAEERKAVARMKALHGEVERENTQLRKAMQGGMQAELSNR